MNQYDIFFIEGTYIEINADGVLDENGSVDFYEVTEDETWKIVASFNTENIAGYCEAR